MRCRLRRTANQRAPLSLARAGLGARGGPGRAGAGGGPGAGTDVSFHYDALAELDREDEFGDREARGARIGFLATCLDPRGSEEWVGLLHLRVQVSMRSLHGALGREASAAYEVRGVRLAPPRPFDQLALLVGDLGAVTDRARVGEELRRLVDDHEAFRTELEGLRGRHPGR